MMKTALLILRRAFSLLTTEPAVVFRILLPVVLGFCFFCYVPVAWQSSATSASVTPGFWLLAPVALLWALVVTPSCAVAFHRYALTGEQPSGLLPGFNTKRWLPYFWRAFVVGLLIMIVSIALILIMSILLRTFHNIWMAYGLTFLMSWFLQWLTLRMMLVLPDVALRESRFSISESIKMTKPVSGALWALAIPLAIIELIPGMIEPPDGLAFAVSAAMTSAKWIIVLAIATTLYGHLVENRSLEDA